MLDFLFRALALGLRFSCPLLIIAISTQETLGQYYLFTSFFTMAAVFISIEIGTPFSEKYLKCTSPNGKRLIFSSFVFTLLLISCIISIPFVLGYLLLYPKDNYLVIFLAALFVSEACVNEVGRFYWNVGLTKEASLRDFVRALAFTMAILSAIFLKGEVVNLISLLLLTAFNTTISILEFHRLGNFRISHVRFEGIRWPRLKTILRKSSIQFIHLQILISQSFFERLLLEKKLGIGAVGMFAFQTTMIQASSTLFLMPIIAKTRRLIFSTLGNKNQQASRSSLFLLAKISSICVLIAIMLHQIIPFIGFIQARLVGMNTLTLALSTLGAIATVFSAAVGALFCRPGSSIKANLQSLLAIGTLLVPFLMESNSPRHIWLAIMCSHFLQIIFRVLDFAKNSYREANLPST